MIPLSARLRATLEYHGASPYPHRDNAQLHPGNVGVYSPGERLIAWVDTSYRPQLPEEPWRELWHVLDRAAFTSGGELELRWWPDAAPTPAAAQDQLQADLSYRYHALPAAEPMAHALEALCPLQGHQAYQLSCQPTSGEPAWAGGWLYRELRLSPLGLPLWVDHWVLQPRYVPPDRSTHLRLRPVSPLPWPDPDSFLAAQDRQEQREGPDPWRYVRLMMALRIP